MKLLGFTFDRRGITLPFSTINIPIPLILLLMQTISAARAIAFPSDGSFGEQVDWVNSLRKGGCSENTSMKLREIITSENPFAELSDMPIGTSATVHRHEFDSTHGVVMRRLMISEPNFDKMPNLIESETVLIGAVGEGAEEITFKFSRSPDGFLKVESKEKSSILKHAEGLEKTPIGLTVSIETPYDHCYTHNARP